MTSGHRSVAALLLLVACVAAGLLDGQQVGADWVGESQRQIQRRIEEWNVSFKQAMQEHFYRRRDEYGYFLKVSPRFAELQMFVEVGHIELIQYEYKRRALLVAKHIIDNYFAGPRPLGPIPKTKSAVDYIVSLLVMRACEGENELPDHQRHRMIIFLLAKYFYSQTTIKYHSRNYYLRLRNRRFVTGRARRVMEKAEKRFKHELSYLSQEAMPEVFQAIDALISEAESQCVDDDPQVRDFVLDFQDDIDETAEEALKRSRRLNPGQLGPAGLDDDTKNFKFQDALDHEITVTEHPLGLVMVSVADPTPSEVVHQSGWRIDRLDWEFDDYIAKDFHDLAVKLHQEHQSYLPLALSALLAECSALLYATEARILRIATRRVEQLFITGTRPLSEAFVENSYLVELFVNRAAAIAVESGLVKTIDLRRQIYLMLTQHEELAYLKVMARKFYDILQEKLDRYRESDESGYKSLKMYRNDVSYVLPDFKFATTIAAIDKVINDAVERRQLNTAMRTMTDSLTLDHAVVRHAIGEDLYNEIRRRSQEARAQGLAFSPEQIAAVDMQQVVQYEQDIMAHVQLPPPPEPERERQPPPPRFLDFDRNIPLRERQPRPRRQQQ